MLTLVKASFPAYPTEFQFPFNITKMAQDLKLIYPPSNATEGIRKRNLGDCRVSLMNPAPTTVNRPWLEQQL